MVAIWRPRGIVAREKRLEEDLGGRGALLLLMDAPTPVPNSYLAP